MKYENVESITIKERSIYIYIYVNMKTTQNLHTYYAYVYVYEQSRAEQGEQSKQSRASRAERAEQSRAEQSRAELGPRGQAHGPNNSISIYICIYTKNTCPKIII